MILNRDSVRQLKDAGYTYHELAELAKCPTPVIMQLGQYGTVPEKPIDLDVEALLKAKGNTEQVKEANAETATTVVGEDQPNEVQERRKPGRPPKIEE